MIQVRIKVFRAIDEVEIGKQYIKAHREVLEAYGITKITSNNEEWIHNPYVFVITAETTTDQELLSGIRVQKVGGTQLLPVELAIGQIDPSRIYDLVKEYSSEGAGELCGLWNSRKVAGMGLSYLLTRMGISILNQLGIKTMFGICAELTLPMFKKVGFEIEESLGDKGKFQYPKPDLLAYALIMKNSITLESADTFERKKILKLRNALKENVVETGPKGGLYIEYDLFIPQSWLRG
jgi:hypothetical protein